MRKLAIFLAVSLVLFSADLFAEKAPESKVEQALRVGFECIEKKNYKRAFKAFRFAAEQEHPLGMRMYGIFLTEGIGCWLDTEGGMYWLEQAAFRGDGIAAFSLAEIFARKHRTVSALDMLKRAVEVFRNEKDENQLSRCAQLAEKLGYPDLAAAILLSEKAREQAEPPPPMATGTAWRLNQTDLVTCWHVVEGFSRFEVAINGVWYSCSFVVKDEKLDLAVLRMTKRFPQTGYDPLVLNADDSNVKLGSFCFTLGFPQANLQGVRVKYTEGTISSLQGFRDYQHEYQISCEVQPGNSGGPLLDDTGRVIGVIEAQLKKGQNVNYAICGAALRSFLTRHGISYTASSTAEEAHQRTKESMIERCTPAVFLIRSTR